MARMFLMHDHIPWHYAFHGHLIRNGVMRFSLHKLIEDRCFEDVSQFYQYILEEYTNVLNEHIANMYYFMPNGF